MLGRDVLEQLRHLLRPLQVRIANSIARAVVQTIGDSTKLQLLQLGVLDGEDIDDAERVQEYGFSSVPLAGAEAVVVFPNGDRGHPLVVAVDDRRYRPTGGQAGEVTVYNDAGAYVRLTKDGDILVRAKPGREVLVDDGSGTPVALAKKSDVEALKTTFDAHVHVATVPIVGAAGTTAVAMAVPATPAPAPAGTTVLKAK